MSFSLLLSLSIHSFIEGIPLTAPSDILTDVHQLYWSIILHKFPSAFAFCLILLQNCIPKKKIWLYLIVFSLMNPFGAWCGSLLAGNGIELGMEVLKAFTAIATGSFIHISTTILYESSNHHRITTDRLIFVALGAFLAAVV